MAITGAIFDCDGTLVDSMPMWRRVTIELLEKHGVPDAEKVFEETESLSNDDMCQLFHDEYGVCDSPEEVLDELRDLVRHEYATTVEMYPGVPELLKSLYEAHIPMIVASSTVEDDVRLALKTQGIEQYFQDVIFAGDVGRSKEYPDVYLEALRRLGTDRATTWVFEDAPFGLRTAKRAGFHTVCIFNGHDGRDEGFLHQWADLFCHDYRELSLALLEDYADADMMEAPTEDGSQAAHSDNTGSKTLRALIVDGSPEPSSPELVASLAAQADYIIAADKGTETLHAAGVQPDVFCGDADSVSPEAAAWAREAAATDIKLPREKYATDFAYAIGCARHEAARRSVRLELVVSCATGGRLDHQLAVVGLLTQARDSSPRLVEDGFECRILSLEGEASWSLGAEPDAAGATFSAIAVLPDSVVSEHGCQWELDHHELGLLADVGVSNLVSSPECMVSCEAGAVAVFLNKAR